MFKVPPLPTGPLLDLSLQELSRNIHSEHSASIIPNPSSPEHHSTSIPAMPELLSAIDLHLGEPFAGANDRYHRPTLFQSTPSRINPAVPFSNSLSQSPATPGLMLTSKYEPLSSPETVLSTPWSTIFDWQPVSGPGIFEPEDTIPPNSAHAVPKEVECACKALNALGALGMSLFQLIDTVLNAEHSTYFCHHCTAFFQCNSTIVPRILTHIFDDSIGQQLFLKWLPPDFVCDQFCGRISEQMEAAKPFFWINADKFSVDFLQNFDLQRDRSVYSQEHLLS